MVAYDEDLDSGLRAVADSTRRQILSLLQGGEQSVQGIAERFPMSRPAISKHLRILKDAGLVVETPVGRQRLYTLEAEPLGALIGWLAGFNGGESSRTGRSARGSSYRAPVRNELDWRVW